MHRRAFLAASASAALAATPTGKVRTGVLGVQHSHCLGKMAAMRANPSYELVALAEPDAPTRERFLANPAAQPYRDLPFVSMDALLADDSLDLIVFEGEVRDAIPWATRILEAGKHLHLEKPPSDQLEPFRKVVELAREKRRLLQLGYIWRRHAGIQAALDAYRAGWLGEVFMIRATINSDRDAPQRAVEARYPGGSMFELAGHVLDRIVAFLGRPSKINHWLRHDTSVADDLADNTLAVLEFDKALAVVMSSAKMAGATGNRSFEVIGTDGTFMIQPMEPVPVMKVFLRQPHGPYQAGWQQITLPEQPRYIGDMNELAEAILEGRPLTDSYDHELLLQETLLRASGM